MSEPQPLLSIGSRCSYHTCLELDFLPIICQCNRSFCRRHIQPEAHGCLYDPASNKSKDLISPHKLLRCDLSTCFQPSLAAFSSDKGALQTCNRCHGSFCAAHRHQSSHSCTTEGLGSLAQSQRTASARALLAKNFSTFSSSKGSPRVTKVPTDPVKLAQYRKVELMKLRHRAVVGSPQDGSPLTPIDQRIHVRIVVSEGNEQVFWFRKVTITGKVLDILARHIKMNSSNGSCLHLNKVLPNGDNQVLFNDRYIADQVEDGDMLVVTCDPMKTVGF